MQRSSRTAAGNQDGERRSAVTPSVATDAASHEDELLNPFDLPETEGSTADDMRMKLLFDLAYAAALEGLWSFLRMETAIVVKTPLVMLRGVGR